MSITSEQKRGCTRDKIIETYHKEIKSLKSNQLKYQRLEDQITQMQQIFKRQQQDLDQSKDMWDEILKKHKKQVAILQDQLYEIKELLITEDSTFDQLNMELDTAIGSIQDASSKILYKRQTMNAL